MSYKATKKIHTRCRLQVVRLYYYYYYYYYIGNRQIVGNRLAVDCWLQLVRESKYVRRGSRQSIAYSYSNSYYYYHTISSQPLPLPSTILHSPYSTTCYHSMILIIFLFLRRTASSSSSSSSSRVVVVVVVVVVANKENY